MIPYNPFTLEGKVILVTGASSGIGKEIAIESSKMGAELIISARNKTRLDQTFRQLSGQNHKQSIANLLNYEEIESLASDLPPLDGIVHVAGIFKPKLFQFLNKEELNLVMNTNFIGPVLLTNCILRRKLFRKNSSIVFISSISGVFCSSIGGASYSASKGALNGVVKGMALALASKKIRINSILPGMIETDLLKESSISNDQIKLDKERYPLGRYGKPADIAYATIYFLSDASSWVTGSNLLIDGGYTLV